MSEQELAIIAQVLDKVASDWGDRARQIAHNQRVEKAERKLRRPELLAGKRVELRKATLARM